MLAAGSVGGKGQSGLPPPFVKETKPTFLIYKSDLFFSILKKLMSVRDRTKGKRMLENSLVNTQRASRRNVTIRGYN